MLLKRRSLFWELFLAFLLVMLTTNIVLYFYMSSLIRSYVYSVESKNIKRESMMIKDSIEGSFASNGSLQRQENFVMTVSTTLNYRIWLVNTSGVVVYDTSHEENESELPRNIFLEALNGQTSVAETQNYHGEPFLTVATPINLGGDKKIRVLVVHTPISGINSAVREVEKQLLFGSVLVLFASALVSFYFTRKLTMPINRLIEVTDEVGRGNYTKIDVGDIKNELSDLSVSFNNMIEKLSQIDEERERLDKVKKDFISDLSHELRTPLTTLEAFLEALKDGMVADEEKRRKYVFALYDETMHLKRLASDLLQLARIESGHLVIDRSPFNPAELINDLLGNLFPLAARKGNSLILARASECPDIWCDRDHFRQIVTNLVKNAIQFTSGGIIMIKMEIEEQQMVVSVLDNGIGISPNQITFIWNRFFKVDKARSKQHHETGLGLSIVKHLVELHGGRVGVESTPGEGSNFYFTLPLNCELKSK